MKKVTAILILIVMFSAIAHSQVKQPKETLYNRATGNLILGIFNPKNFSMNHSFQISLMSSRYGNMSVTSYINSMSYRFSDRLSVSADVKLQYVPLLSSPLGQEHAAAFKKDLTGLTLSRLSVDYKISDNSYLNFQFRKFDELDYLNYYNYNPYYYFK